MNIHVLLFLFLTPVNVSSFALMNIKWLTLTNSQTLITLMVDYLLTWEYECASTLLTEYSFVAIESISVAVNWLHCFVGAHFVHSRAIIVVCVCFYSWKWSSTVKKPPWLKRQTKALFRRLNEQYNMCILTCAVTVACTMRAKCIMWVKRLYIYIYALLFTITDKF